MVEVKEIIIKKAEELPIETQNKFNVHTGFVEVRLERSSPIEAKIVPLNETAGSRFLKILEKAGFSQKDFE